MQINEYNGIKNKQPPPKSRYWYEIEFSYTSGENLNQYNNLGKLGGIYKHTLWFSNFTLKIYVKEITTYIHQRNKIAKYDF